MTNKQVFYSDHAVGRLKRRKVSRAEVRWLLAHGKLEKESSQYGGSAWSRAGYLGKHEARIIFIEQKHAVLIITVEFVPKTPRERRHHPKEKY